MVEQSSEFTVIRPREKDLGEMTVRRVLPSGRQRMVGPFVFFDHMGPATFPPGKGIQVRPHPHIGIATITYLFEGEIFHRDSLGFAQPILPGAVNLMTAGSGIVHSERAGSDLDRDARLHGIQSWIALPDDQQEIPPAFAHTPADELPEIREEHATVRVIMGDYAGARSPVQCYSETLYLDVELQVEGRISLPGGVAERAVYAATGQVAIAGHSLSAGEMLLLPEASELDVFASEPSRLLVIGGEPLGERHIWWNFVSNSLARIEQAKEQWREGGFDRVPGDDEFIPLPD
ncbi:MAG: pirin family protein [Pseudomonadota bacterium]